jgi:hypothetical protein
MLILAPFDPAAMKTLSEPGVLQWTRRQSAKPAQLEN